MTATTKPRLDVYTRVTNRIVEQLEQGVRPWSRPWGSGPISRPLRSNGEPYHGVNVLVLWDAAMTAGYDSPHWLTFQQAKQLGGFVRKGEHGTGVVYISRFRKKETDDDGEEVEKEIPFLREYQVFNADQCEGLPQQFSTHVKSPVRPIEDVDQFVRNTQAVIIEGGNEASYSPRLDRIRMPPLKAFRSEADHASTLLHELAHWTGHESRLNRLNRTDRFGSDGYAMEELVAELSAAFLCADLQIHAEPREDHAAYIQCWLRVLKKDRKAVFTAASQASKAAEFLHDLQAQPQAQTSSEEMPTVMAF